MQFMIVMKQTIEIHVLLLLQNINIFLNHSFFGHQNYNLYQLS